MLITLMSTVTLVTPAKATLFNSKGKKTFDFGEGPFNTVSYSPNGRGNIRELNKGDVKLVGLLQCDIFP